MYITKKLTQSDVCKKTHQYDIITLSEVAAGADRNDDVIEGGSV